MDQGDSHPLNDLKWKALFEKCDTNKDGRISYAELAAMIDNGQEEVPDHFVRTVHDKADRDGNGEIDYEEFVTMITQPEHRLLFKHHHSKLVREASKMYLKVFQQSVDSTDGQNGDKKTCCPPPVGMITISVVQVIFFIANESQGVSKDANTNVGSWLNLDPYKRSEIWRFLTYMFVHNGYMHIIVNLIVQLLLGIPLEIFHKWWRVLMVYVAGVIAGSLGTTVLDPSVKLVGASGGGYALITAYVASIYLNWEKAIMPHIQSLMFGIFIVVDTGFAVYNRYYLGINENIGYIAHFTGALAGLLVGVLVLRNVQVTDVEKIVRKVSLILYIILMGTAIIINLAWKSHYPQKQAS